jgi:hypothetical protein
MLNISYIEVAERSVCKKRQQMNSINMVTSFLIEAHIISMEKGLRIAI